MFLTAETFVMHDHNTLNYNAKYHFRNIECGQHLDRDLQKNSDDTQHTWSDKVKKLINITRKERAASKKLGKESFGDSYIKNFHRKLNEYLTEGWEDNQKDRSRYASSDEKALLKRIQKYRENYFMWLKDFTLPTTNNLSLCELIIMRTPWHAPLLLTLSA